MAVRQPLPIIAWLEREQRPSDFYELLGVARLDPDIAALSNLVRQASRKLFPFQSHPDPRKAQRAVRLQLELGRAADILANPPKLADYRRQILQQLSAKWKDEPDAQVKDKDDGSLRKWLVECQQLHPSSMDDAIAQCRSQLASPAVAALNNGHEEVVLLDLWDASDEAIAAESRPGNIHVRCPRSSCHKHYVVSDEYAGTTIRCPRCRGKIPVRGKVPLRIDASPKDSSDPPFRLPPRIARKKQRPAEPKRTQWLAQLLMPLILCTLGCLSLAGICAAVYFGREVAMQQHMWQPVAEVTAPQTNVKFFPANGAVGVSARPQKNDLSSFTALGANIEELRSRFGESDNSNPSSAHPGATEFTFVAGRLKVNATVFRNKCCAVDFITLDGSHLPDQDVELLLSANAGGFAWLKSEYQPNGLQTWGQKAGASIFRIAALLNNGTWRKNRLAMIAFPLLPEEANDPLRAVPAGPQSNQNRFPDF